MTFWSADQMVSSVNHLACSPEDWRALVGTLAEDPPYQPGMTSSMEPGLTYPLSFSPLGHTHYMLWLTDSDKEFSGPSERKK